jgi:uncharacterized protein with WD repeat
MNPTHKMTFRQFEFGASGLRGIGFRGGMRGGSSWFRRRKSPEQCRQEVAEQVKRLRDERDDDSANGQNASAARRQAALERAAREREKRVAAALRNLEPLQPQKEQRKKGSGEEARCSTTAPHARRTRDTNA